MYLFQKPKCLHSKKIPKNVSGLSDAFGYIKLYLQTRYVKVQRESTSTSTRQQQLITSAVSVWCLPRVVNHKTKRSLEHNIIIFYQSLLFFESFEADLLPVYQPEVLVRFKLVALLIFATLKDGVGCVCTIKA